MADVGDLQQQLTARDTEIADLRRQLESDNGTMKQLLEISTLLNSTLNLSELLQSIIGAMAELTGAESGSLLLVDEETGELVFQIVTDDPNQAVVEQRLPPGQGVAGWVAQHAEPAIIADPATDSRFYQQIDRSSGFVTRNLLAVPLKVKERVVGVAEAINKRGGSSFTQADMELAVALASQASIAIDNTRMYARLAEAVIASRLSYRL